MLEVRLWRGKHSFEARVRWHGVDPETGEDWAPDWRHVGNLDRAAKEEAWALHAASRQEDPARPAPESARVFKRLRPGVRRWRRTPVVAQGGGGVVVGDGGEGSGEEVEEGGGGGDTGRKRVRVVIEASESEGGEE